MLPDGSGEVIATLDGQPVLTLKIPATAFVFEATAPVPTQNEVDSLAAFVEAADELEREPFFGPDEKRTYTTGGKFQEFRLGDRFHFRSALISFRRIWQEGETSNFLNVCGILWRHAKSVGDRASIQWARQLVKDIENGKNHHPLDVEIAGRDLISLWINTVFAHGGGDQRRKHKRADFDRYVTDCGQGQLEFAFRNAVWMIGIQYINLAKLGAKPMLARWESEHGLKPTFQIGSAFGTSTRERTKEGHIIVRRASSEYSSNETFDQRLKRLLERQKFQTLQFVLENLELGDRNPVRIVLKSDSFSTLVTSLGYEIKIVEHVSDKFDEYGDDFRGSTGPYNGRKHSRLHLYGSHVVTDEIGLEILTGQLNELRKVLISE